MQPNLPFMRPDHRLQQPLYTAMAANPAFDRVSGGFRNPLLERRFLEAYEVNFTRRDRYVVMLIFILELLLIAVDYRALGEIPEVSRMRIGLRGIYMCSLVVIAGHVFTRNPLSRWSHIFLLLSMLLHNALMATYHHPQLFAKTSPWFLLAIYIFTITAYYTFLSPWRKGILLVSTAFGLQYILLRMWLQPPDPMMIYSPFLVFGLIAFSQYTAASQARQHRQVWMGAEHAKRLQRLAEEAQGFRTRLLELVGHDLHQPLGALRYYLTALRYETLSLEQPAAERLGKISASIDLVNKQVTDMLNKALELAQLDNAAVVARCRSQPILPLVQELRDRFASEARMQGIALRFYGTDGMLVHDPALMSAVLRNLVGNALRYHSRATPHPRVVVAFRQGARRIDILDNGGGISPECESQLNAPQFDRQLDNVLGHGLGLAIARQFADKQGWQMQIHNHPAAGLWFRLRHVQAQITDPGSAADAEEPGAGGALPQFDSNLERGVTS